MNEQDKLAEVKRLEAILANMEWFGNNFDIEGTTAVKCLNKEITSVTIPEAITKIGAKAFESCLKLTTITIPKTITHIDSNAFSNCFRLKEVYYEGSLEDWCKIDFATQRSNPVFYNATLFIDGEEVKTLNLDFERVECFAFCGLKSLTEVTIGENVKSLGSMIFAECKNLQKITFNAVNCANLTPSHKVFCVEDGKEVEVFIGNKVTKIPDFLFASHEQTKINISSLVFEENSVCEVIGESAFEKANNPDFNFLDIPDSVKELKEKSFSGCENLLHVTLGRSLTTVGPRVFEDCKRVEEIANKSEYEVIAYDYKTRTLGNLIATLSRVYSPDEEESNIVVDGDYTYYLGKNKPTLIHVKGALDKTEFEFPKHFRHDKYDLGSYIFKGSKNLTTVTIPNGVDVIGSDAFMDCKNLKTVTIADGVTYISSNAFRNCTALEQVKLSDDITSISFNAFDGCTSLKEINMPKYLWSVSSWAFRNCPITELTFYDRVDYFSDSAFEDMPSLQTVTCPKKVAKVVKKALKKSKCKAKLIVTKW